MVCTSALRNHTRWQYKYTNKNIKKINLKYNHTTTVDLDHAARAPAAAAAGVDAAGTYVHIYRGVDCNSCPDYQVLVHVYYDRTYVYMRTYTCTTVVAKCWTQYSLLLQLASDCN
jgi:hypothetical protein